MNRYRTQVGLALSVIWIALAVLIYVGSDPPIKANEWGDFLAGMCAPLAFLWLVLGYLQQGEELRHSSAALKLQAEELRNSVEQQTQLVSIERDLYQHELQRSKDIAEQEALADMPQPRVAGVGVSVGSRPYVEIELTMMNIGGDYIGVELIPSDTQYWRGTSFPILDTKKTVVFTLKMSDEPLRIFMSGRTAKRREVFFEMSLFKEDYLSYGYMQWHEIDADRFAEQTMPF